METTLEGTTRNNSTTRFFSDLVERVHFSLLEVAQPGERLPSERQLAQQYGVSNVTIARVLRDLQEDGVLHRVPGKGTFLSEGAFREKREAKPHELFSSKVKESAAMPHRNGEVAIATETLNLWVLIAFNPEDVANRASERMSLRMLSTIERLVQKQGGKIVVTNYELPCDTAREIDKLSGVKINGIVVIGQLNFDENSNLGHDLTKVLLRRSVNNEGEQLPAVHIPLNGSTPMLPIDQVRYSELHGIDATFRYLIELGHQEIAYIAPGFHEPEIYDWIERRIQYLRALMVSEGLSSRFHVLNGSYEPEEFAVAQLDEQTRVRNLNAVQRFLNDAEFAKVTAVICANDHTAQVLIQEATAAGRNIPRDLSVVGFDDSIWAGALRLTSVHIPAEEMAERAVNLLQQRLRSPKRNESTEIVLNPTLVVRETTQPHQEKHI